MRLFLILLTLIVSTLCPAQVIWLEDFNGLANGTTSDNGTTAWSIDLATYCSGSVSGSFDVQSNELVANDTDCDAIWQSEWIDVSSYSLVQIAATLDGAGSLDAGGGNPDTCKVGYRVDGGTAITWLDEYAGTAVINSVSCGGTVSGDSVQVVVQSSTTGGDEFHYIDDVTVSVASSLPVGGGDTLFSRQSGDWDQTATWSTTPNGASCSCTPNSSSIVYITCGETVAIDGDGNAKEVHVLFGGRLEWDANNVELNLHDDAVLEVEIGGELDENGQGTAAIDFEGTGNCTISVYDVTTGIDIDRININDNGTFVFEGGGRMNIQDDFDVNADGATITNNMTSQFYITDDLIVDGNNLTFVNNGYIYIDDRFDLNDQDIDFTNNDSLWVDGDFDGNNADDGQFTNASGAYVRVDGDDFELSDNSDNFRVDNFGTFQIDDDLKESASGATACEWHNRTGGVFLIGHNDADMNWEMHASYTNNTVNYFRAANQDRIFVPEDGSYWNLTLSGSNRKRTISNLDINGNVLIDGTAQFDPDNGNDDLTVAGNWTVSSTNGAAFDFGTEDVTFDGTGTQVVSGVNGADFYNVILNKDDTLELQSEMDIVTGGTMTFTDGHVLSDSVNRLRIADGAFVASVSNASYVDGRVEKIGNDVFTFPVGDRGNYQPLAISAPTGVTHAFTAQYLQEDPRGSYDHESLEATINHVSTEEYWILNRTTGASSVSVQLTFDGNSGGVDNLDSLIVARWDGSQWTDGGNGATTGNTAGGTVTSDGAFSAFSPFTLGSTINDFDQNPLPVELYEFGGTCYTDKTVLHWIVLSEFDVDRFVVEKFENGVFTRVGEVESLGKSLQERRYTFTVSDPADVYRLTEISLNGKRTVLAQAKVECYNQKEVLQSSPILLYPNPVNGNTINIAYSGEMSAIGFALTHQVFDAKGALVLERQTNAANSELAIGMLPKGIYNCVSTLENGQRFVTRFIKQ